ncbi:MAG: hypothetical protein Q4G27_05425 [Flavobacteriaceae bacterium]|nr:hypothetical protein [Flavobacteriaceae bacterium]
MRKLEKLEAYQLENVKLLNTFGGKGGDLETSPKGERELQNYPSNGYCTCVTYTGDKKIDGNWVYFGEVFKDSYPC